MNRYKSAYELGLDPLDLQLCLEMESNQHDYDGNRQNDDEPVRPAPPADTTTP
jgi:hypothetical protein